MNIASAFLKQVLVLQDFDTWSQVRKHYLPVEYHKIFSAVDKHCNENHKMPSIEELTHEIRDYATKEKLLAITTIKVDTDSFMLLQYLKNEYTQKEILNSLENYVDNSIAFEDAEESVAHLHQIVLDIEDKVDLQLPQESMQRINLFENDQEISRYLPLGLNSEYDIDIQFSPRDYILVGGKRGQGKSVICANIANNVFEAGKSSIYFTIEMDSRSTLQRFCSIATGVPLGRLRTKNLNIVEWEKVATWWASRFVDGQIQLEKYRQKRDFDKFHHDLTTNSELLPTQQLDVVYDPELSLSKIRAELDKKIKSQMDVGVVVVDYINQVKRGTPGFRSGQYDWTEQIEVSKALKAMAQEYETPVFSAYQTDASGEARFAKGILDSADAAYTLETWSEEDACMTLNCVKMRNAAMRSFSSKIDWETLKVGPETQITPKEREGSDLETGEPVNDFEL